MIFCSLESCVVIIYMYILNKIACFVHEVYIFFKATCEWILVDLLFQLFYFKVTCEVVRMNPS